MRDYTDARRLDSLTGLRALAALAVFGVHVDFIFRGSRKFAALHDITRQGAVGVSLFFILSGFVLAWRHEHDELSKTQFWRRRAARVVPAYAVAFVISLAVTVDLLRRDLAPSLGRALFTGTLMQAWIPSPRWFSGGNTVGWSLSTELFFYALFPFIVRPIAAFAIPRKMLVLTAALILSIAVPAALHPSAHAVATQHGWEYWLIYISPPVRLLEFTAGVSLAGLMRDGVRCRVPLFAAAVLAAAAYVAAGYAPLWAGLVAVTVVPFTFLIAAAAQRDLDARTSPLRGRWFVLAGTWSYAFYLVHDQIIRLATYHLLTANQSPARKGALIVSCFIAAAFSAYLLYRFVEHPAERRLRNARPRAEELSIFQVATTQD